QRLAKLPGGAVGLLQHQHRHFDTVRREARQQHQQVLLRPGDALDFADVDGAHQSSACSLSCCSSSLSRVLSSAICWAACRFCSVRRVMMIENWSMTSSSSPKPMTNIAAGG